MDGKDIIRYFSGHDSTFICFEDEADYMFLMSLLDLLRYKIDNSGELTPPIQEKDGVKYCVNAPSRLVWVNGANGTIVFLPSSFIPKVYWSSAFFCLPMASEND